MNKMPQLHPAGPDLRLHGGAGGSSATADMPKHGHGMQPLGFANDSHAVVRLDRRLGWLVDFAAGALVLADILVLLAGVIARFVFHSAARMVGRTRLDDLHLAGDAGRGHCTAPRRTYEHDRGVVQAVRRASHVVRCDQRVCCRSRFWRWWRGRPWSTPQRSASSRRPRSRSRTLGVRLRYPSASV